MKFVFHLASSILALAVFSSAQGLPDAPSTAKLEPPLLPIVAVQAPRRTEIKTPEKVKLIDKKFLTLTAISTAATFADSFTTTWARQNWLAGKHNVCNVESQSAFLYGLHPTPARAYTIAAFKSAGTAGLAYFMRKKHFKFWSVPLLANTALSLQGVGNNLSMCN